MSLINDALKKAQKLQTQQSTAPAAPPPPAPVGMPAVVARRGNALRFETILLSLVALVVVLVGATAIAVMVFKKEIKPGAPSALHVSPPTPGAPSAPTEGAAPVTKAVAKPAITGLAPSTAPTTAQVSPPAATAAPTPPVPLAESQPTTLVTARAPAPIPAVAAPVPAPEGEPVAPPVLAPTTPAPVKAAPAAVAETAAAEPPPASVAQNQLPTTVPEAKPLQPAGPKQNRKIVTFINNLHVTGIRVAGDDSKVLMNNRVYRLNDMIDYDLGVKLTGVSTTTLTFMDENGVVYTRSL